MRDIFIRGFEIVLTLVLIAAFVGVAVVAIGALFGGVPVGEMVIEGPLMAVIVALGGWLALLVVGGILYLPLGIYANTQRTADALELLITLRR